MPGKALPILSLQDFHQDIHTRLRYDAIFFPWTHASGGYRRVVAKQALVAQAAADHTVVEDAGIALLRAGGYFPKPTAAKNTHLANIGYGICFLGKT